MKMRKWFFMAVVAMAAIAFTGCPGAGTTLEPDEPGPGPGPGPGTPPPAVPDPELVLPFDPGPVNPDAVWTMATDEVIQALDGQIAFPDGATDVLGDWLQMAGSAAGTAHAIADESRVVGSRFLRRAGRTDDWNTFDIRTTAEGNLVNFQEGVPHVITVWGWHATPDVEIRFGQPENPWNRFSGYVTAGADGLFMLRRTFTWAEISEGQNRIRFLPDSEDDFEIFNINVVPAVALPPPGGDAAEWQAVIDSPFVSNRGGAITATADGILISGRGTGQHDHNNGLILDVAALRYLYDGTPAIVITGTIAGATEGNMVMQGMGTEGAVGAGGAFTVTLPYTTAIDMGELGWGNTNGLPWLGSSPGMHGNILITSIMIGTDSIRDMVELTPPPPPPPPPGPPGGGDPVTVNITRAMANRFAGDGAPTYQDIPGGLRLNFSASPPATGVVDFSFAHEAFPDNATDFRYITVNLTEVVNNAPADPIRISFGWGFDPGANQFAHPMVEAPSASFTFPMSTTFGGGGPGISILSNQPTVLPDGPSTNFSFVLSSIVFHDDGEGGGVLFSLADIAPAAPGSFADGYGLQLAGATGTWIQSGDAIVLELTRTDGWQGLDLAHSEFEFQLGDVVTVEGRITPQAGWAAIIQNAAPGGWRETGQSGNANAGTLVTSTNTIDELDLAAITGASPQGIRITVNSADAATLYIYSITIERP